MTWFNAAVLGLLFIIATSGLAMANERYFYCLQILYYKFQAWQNPFKIGDLLYAKWLDRYAEGDNENHVEEYVEVVAVKNDFYTLKTIGSKKKNSNPLRTGFNYDNHMRKTRVHRDYKLSIRTLNAKEIEDFINGQ